MPGVTIKDGAGKGYEAEVNSLNQLRVHALAVSAEHFFNHRYGQAFSDRLRQTAGASPSCLAYMENTGDRDIILEGVTQSVDGACELYVMLNQSGTRNAATDNVSRNLNTGSGVSLTMIMEHGTDLAGGAATLTGGYEVERAIFRAAVNSSHYNFPCDIIIAPGGTATLWCDTAGVDVMSTLFMYIAEEQE